MVKIKFSDVVPPERRSIRNIPIPTGGKRRAAVARKSKPAEPEPLMKVEDDFKTVEKNPDDIRNSEVYKYYYPKEHNEVDHQASGRNRKFIFGGLALLVIVGFVVSMMTVFASASIFVTPKSQDIEVSTEIVATQEISTSSVRYEVIKLAKSQTESVSANGEESVKREARGKIMIYNNFSSDPQRLIVRTRFETPEGLIYRIPESVVVPGKSIKDGVETPGSIEVQVVADEAGEKYNIKKTDFTIPGFKTDAVRYKNFYARSVTPMEGGFVGNVKKVLPTDKENVLQKIDTELKAALLKDAQSKVPDGLVLLENAIIFDSKELAPVDGDSSVAIGKETVAYLILLNQQDLSKVITSKYLINYPEWKNIKGKIADFGLLKVGKKSDQLPNGQNLDLTLSGKVKIVADLDTSAVAQKLVGAPKQLAGNLINDFPGILGITVTLRPVWKQTFPDNLSKIRVKIESPK